MSPENAPELEVKGQMAMVPRATRQEGDAPNNGDECNENKGIVIGCTHQLCLVCSVGTADVGGSLFYLPLCFALRSVLPGCVLICYCGIASFGVPGGEDVLPTRGFLVSQGTSRVMLQLPLQA